MTTLLDLTDEDYFLIEDAIAANARGRAFLRMRDQRSRVVATDDVKTILNNINPTANPTTQLIALQELSKLQSISIEDTLSGYFPVDAFVKEIVKIMGGKQGQATQDKDWQR